jgi:S1-C subfamily serine protease
MAVFDELPFPFGNPAAQELLRTLMALYRTEREALALVEQFGIDPADITPALSTRNLWHELLRQTAVHGVTRQVVQAARDQYPRNPRAAFLESLLAGQPAPVSAEPTDATGAPRPFLRGSATASEPEALLFFDDLTLPCGRVPALIETLTRMQANVPAVCLLRSVNAAGEFFGTGFRIGADLLLTNEHVLFPKEARAFSVFAASCPDIDGAGSSLPVTSLSGDPATIVGDRADDWAAVRVAGMNAAWPILDLTAAPVPRSGDLAYILQHPGGQRKRLGFVRNTISDVDDRVVHYLTDTQPGSSGAPVFDAAGQLIALHHAGGDPVEVLGKPPVAKNEGIRIDRVREGLRAKGLVA